eukprot:367552_1
MAFEVFDDVAFYWFLQVILGITLLPITLYKIRELFTRKDKLRHRAHPFVSSIPDYIPKIKLVSEEDKSIDKTLSLRNIFFAFSWILFCLLLIQLPKWHNRQMTSFEPFDVLEIAKGSSESAIKRAYRKMSLKYHPDKCTKEPLNLPEAKCKDMFIMVRKAYETLTDEKTKDNYEKYGNPDGYKGTSVTIGLPSWLTHKENELAILSVYFFALIVLVAVVWTWWNHSNKFHKSGVFKRSIDIYWRFIKQDMRLRHLLDILSASAEYRMLDVSIPNETDNKRYKDFCALEQQILSVAQKRGGHAPNKQRLDNIFNASYARKAAALLHAHLMGMTIPTSLYTQYMLVLQEAPRLLDVMIDMTVSRERFFPQTMQLIQLKQAIIQGVWPMESHLKQLPHWTPAIDQGIRKKGYPSVLALNFLGPDELCDTLNNVYSEYSEDHSHLISPLKDTDEDSNLNDDNEYSSTTTKKSKKGNKRNKKRGKNKNKKQSASPAKKEEEEEEEGEDGADDLLPPGTLADPQEVQMMASDALACIRMYPFVRMSYCARTYDEKEIFNEDIVKVTVHLERLRAPWECDRNAFDFVSKMEAPEFSNKNIQKSEYSDADGLDFVDNELEDARRLQIARLNAPVVHVNKFPFRIREKWLVMLVDLQANIVIDQRAIPDLSGLRKVDLHFRAQKPRSGKYPYRLVVKCDSYLGADKHVNFEVFINCDHDKRINQSKRRRKATADEDDESSSEVTSYNIPKDDDENHEPKWYYLWNENFWEFLLTLFLLYFIYLVIMSSSWGKKYLQPYMDIATDRVIYPMSEMIHKNVNDFVINPISKQLQKETGFDLIKWWYNLDQDAAADGDNPYEGIDEDDILSEEQEEFFKYANQQFKSEQ